MLNAVDGSEDYLTRVPGAPNYDINGDLESDGSSSESDSDFSDSDEPLTDSHFDTDSAEE